LNAAMWIGAFREIIKRRRLGLVQFRAKDLLNFSRVIGALRSLPRNYPVTSQAIGVSAATVVTVLAVKEYQNGSV